MNNSPYTCRLCCTQFARLSERGLEIAWRYGLAFCSGCLLAPDWRVVGDMIGVMPPVLDDVVERLPPAMRPRLAEVFQALGFAPYESAHTLCDECSAAELRELDGIGVRTVAQVAAALDHFGLELPRNPPPAAGRREVALRHRLGDPGEELSLRRAQAECRAEAVCEGVQLLTPAFHKCWQQHGPAVTLAALLECERESREAIHASSGVSSEAEAHILSRELVVLHREYHERRNDPDTEEMGDAGRESAH